MSQNALDRLRKANAQLAELEVKERSAALAGTEHLCELLDLLVITARGYIDAHGLSSDLRRRATSASSTLARPRRRRSKAT